MSSAVPASLKPVRRFLQQAAKVAPVQPVVAYHTKLYALQRAFALSKAEAGGKRDAEASAFLAGLMAELEAEKGAGESVEKDEARVAVEEFSLQVFRAADEQDRRGEADQNTARAFLSAHVFMTVCKQFSEDGQSLPSDFEEMSKYAAWKAADITKAIREGRKPVPGGPNDGQDDDDGDDAAESASQYPPPGSYPPPRQTHDEPPAPAADPVPAPSPAPAPAPAYVPSSDYAPAAAAGAAGSVVINPKPGLDFVRALVEAEKLAKHGQSALRFRDVDGSIEKLREAIALLLPHRNSGGAK